MRCLLITRLLSFSNDGSRRERSSTQIALTPKLPVLYWPTNAGGGSFSRFSFDLASVRSDGTFLRV